MSRTIPVPSEPLLGRTGQINPIWWRYLRSIESQGDSSGVQEQIREILRRLAEIPEAREVIGRMSVVVIDQPDGTRTVQLDGDSLTPGSNSFYCTSPTGRRQWAALSQMIGASGGIVFTDSGYTVMGVMDTTDDLPALGNDGEAWWVGNVLYAWDSVESEWAPDYSPSGLLELTLADVVPDVGGTLQKTQFDAKGRRTHEAPATLGDLSDVDLSSLSDGDTIVWDETGGFWVPGTAASGEVMFRSFGGYIQWSDDGGDTWEDLVALSELQGDPGAPGAQGPAGPPGPSSSCFPTASFDGGTAGIAVGAFCDLFIPFGFEITRSTLVGDAAGVLSIDVRVASYATFPPTALDSICDTTPPTLTGVNKVQDATLSGWSPEIASGSVIRFFVTASSGIKRATLVLEGVRT